MLIHTKLKSVIAIFCASTMLVACSQPNSEVAEDVETTDATEMSSEVSPVEANTPIPTKPQWGKMFSQAVSLMGKSKADLVAQLGPPTSTFKMLDRYSYELDSAGLQGSVLSVFMAKDNNVERVELNFSKSEKIDAGTIWDALDTASDKPDSFLTSKFEMNNYWFAKAKGQAPSGWSTAIAFFGDMPGEKKIELVGFTAQPLLKGDPVFDTKEDGYAIKDYYPNGSDTWRSAEILQVTTKIVGLGGPDWKAVTEYPMPK